MNKHNYNQMLRTDQITELAPYVGTYWGPQKLPQIYTVIAYRLGRLRDRIIMNHIIKEPWF